MRIKFSSVHSLKALSERESTKTNVKAVLYF
jgi:hypothetical protein